MSHRITNEKFIQKAKIVHENEYGYDFTVYDGDKKQVIITCFKHGNFPQVANLHLRGSGCSDCAGNKKYTKENFVKAAEKIHGVGKYGYELFNLKNAGTKGIIICYIHGNFEQSVTNHIVDGAGCRECYFQSRRSTLEKFIENADIIFNKKYNYEKFIYINSRTKGIIICPTHGTFDKTPGNHLQGSGCPICQNKNEELTWQFLTNNNINFVYQYNVKLPINKNKYFSEIDFYIPSLNLFIEYNGHQHYEPVTFGGSNLELAKKEFKRQQIRDQQLRDYCKTNNINLLEIDGREYYGKKLKKYLYTYFSIF